MHVKIKKIDSSYKKYVNLIREGESPKVCIVGCLHGNEKIGERIIKELNNLKIERGTLVTIIGNYKALKLHKRFVTQDLNRSFPGRMDGNSEEKMAYQLKDIINKCDIVLDIHSTTTNTKSLIIATKINKKILKLIEVLNPKRFVLMKKSIGKMAMINYCRVGISMEYGKDNNKEAYKRTLRGILSVLNYAGIYNNKMDKKSPRTEFYQVINIIKNNNGFIASKNIKNFKLVKKNDVIAKKGELSMKADENFHPILFGEKEYRNILGFKGKKTRFVVK